MEASEPLNGDDEEEDDGMPKDAQGILDRIKMIGALITTVSIIDKKNATCLKGPRWIKKRAFFNILLSQNINCIFYIGCY